MLALNERYHVFYVNEKCPTEGSSPSQLSVDLVATASGSDAIEFSHGLGSERVGSAKHYDESHSMS